METEGYANFRRIVEALTAGLQGAADRGARWYRIIAAATELFTAYGYRKTSVDEIAQRAHVAKGTIYLYFRTKAGILLHAVVEEKKAYFVRLRRSSICSSNRQSGCAFTCGPS